MPPASCATTPPWTAAALAAELASSRYRCPYACGEPVGRCRGRLSYQDPVKISSYCFSLRLGAPASALTSYAAQRDCTTLDTTSAAN